MKTVLIIISTGIMVARSSCLTVLRVIRACQWLGVAMVSLGLVFFEFCFMIGLLTKGPAVVTPDF